VRPSLISMNITVTCYKSINTFIIQINVYYYLIISITYNTPVASLEI